MKKFLEKMTIFAPIIVIIAILNLTVDPANIYKKEYTGKMAKWMLSGENIVGVVNYDERSLQEAIIRGESGCPNSILVGSSRVMTLSGEVVKGRGRCRNHGMSGAGIFDYLGILGIYESCDKLPETIILGLDPWILNENNDDTRYESLMLYINDFKRTLHVCEKKQNYGKKLNVDRKIQTILSVSYFQNSVKFLLKNPEKFLKTDSESNFYVTKKRRVDESIRYADGSIEYPVAEREKKLEDVNDSARQYVTGEIYQVGKYYSLCKEYCFLLERLIDYLQEKGVETVIYLPPYHPYVYQYFEENTNYENIMNAEKFFRNLAKEKRIDIYGSYNPEKIGCSEEDFMDGMHLKRKKVGKSWKKTYSWELYGQEI